MHRTSTDGRSVRTRPHQPDHLRRVRYNTSNVPAISAAGQSAFLTVQPIRILPCSLQQPRMVHQGARSRPAICTNNHRPIAVYADPSPQHSSAAAIARSLSVPPTAGVSQLLQRPKAPQQPEFYRGMSFPVVFAPPLQQSSFTMPRQQPEPQELFADTDESYIIDSGEEDEDGNPAVAARVCDFASFHQWLCRRKGLRSNSYRFLKDELSRRLEGRIRQLGLGKKDYAGYARLIDKEGTEGTEWAQLDELYTVDISRFFRDGALWQFFISVLWPQVIGRAKGRGGEPVRVWVMGGANGEEVYSLAAAWLLGLHHLSGDLPSLQITVSESDPSCVRRAKQAEYACKQGQKHDNRESRLAESKKSTPAWWSCVKDAETFREVPASWMSELFDSSNRGLVVQSRFQGNITWRCERWQACLEEDWQLSVAAQPFDMVMARHGPFLYPTIPQQQELLQVIRDCMRDEGFLVIGKHENLPKMSREDWQAVQPPECGEVRLKDLAPAIWQSDTASTTGDTKGDKKDGKDAVARIGDPFGMVFKQV